MSFTREYYLSRYREKYMKAREAATPADRAKEELYRGTVDVRNALLDALEQWQPTHSRHHASETETIKFPHWALGSIRVSAHPGNPAYPYKWKVRVDLPDQRTRGVYSTGELQGLVQDFTDHARSRGIAPGDKQTWGEYSMTKRPQKENP
jgi:hypothetical protein